MTKIVPIVLQGSVEGRFTCPMDDGEVGVLVTLDLPSTFDAMGHDLLLGRVRTLMLLARPIPSSPARVSAHGGRDPGKPAWPEHFLRSGGMSLSANHSSSLMFTNAFDSVLIFMTF